MSVSLRHIRYFVAAAETGQISRAAIEMGVSQSAVTAAVRQIEDQVGAQLFERRPHGVALTVAGGRFLRHGRAIIASVNAAMRLEARDAPSVEGVVRVGVTYTVAGYFLPPHHHRFTRSFPNIEVQLREAPRAAIEADLVAGRLDLAVLLTSNIANRAALDSETLIRSRRRLWTPADHPFHARESAPLAEIAAQPYVMLTVDEASETAERYWTEAGVTPNVIFRTSSVEAVRSMVANGSGVTVLSDMVYRPWSLDGLRIETRPVTEEVPSMDVGLAWAKDHDRAAPARAFQDFLSLTFNGAQHALAG